MTRDRALSLVLAASPPRLVPTWCLSVCFLLISPQERSELKPLLARVFARTKLFLFLLLKPHMIDSLDFCSIPSWNGKLARFSDAIVRQRSPEKCNARQTQSRMADAHGHSTFVDGNAVYKLASYSPGSGGSKDPLWPLHVLGDAVSGVTCVMLTPFLRSRRHLHKCSRSSSMRSSTKEL